MDLNPRVARYSSEFRGDLTVILPNFNHARFIRTALESLLAQTRRPNRIIVLDDASTDNSVEIIREYLNRDPCVELVVRRNNVGVVANINDGLNRVKTEYVTFIAADDYIHTQLYEKSLALLDNFPDVPLCGVRVQFVDDLGNPVRHRPDDAFGAAAKFLSPAEVLKFLTASGRLFHGNGTVYRTLHLHKVGGFSPALASFCDGYNIQRLALASGACYIPEQLAFWRRSHTGYAASSMRNVQVLTSILEEVIRRTDNEDAFFFPPHYRRKLIARITFAVVAAASGANYSITSLNNLLPKPLSGLAYRAIALAEMIHVPSFTIGIAALVLRPGDIPSWLIRQLAK